MDWHVALGRGTTRNRRRDRFTQSAGELGPPLLDVSFVSPASTARRPRGGDCGVWGCRRGSGGALSPAGHGRRGGRLGRDGFVVGPVAVLASIVSEVSVFQRTTCHEPVGNG